MEIWEQADRGGCQCGDSTCAPRWRYSWMVDRAYSTRREMVALGWKWIGGRPRGVWVTNDAAAVDAFRRRMAAFNPCGTMPEIVSNGTHAAAGAPMHDLHAARVALAREYRAAGIDATVEIDGFDNLTAAELADEVVYLADFQG